MRNKIALVLSLIILVLGIFQVLNNSLDSKYLVEPFEYNSDNINELVAVLKNRFLNNSYTIVFLVTIHLGVLFLLVTNRKSDLLID